MSCSKASDTPTPAEVRLHSSQIHVWNPGALLISLLTLTPSKLHGTNSGGRTYGCETINAPTSGRLRVNLSAVTLRSRGSRLTSCSAESAVIDAQTFSNYFAEKVDKVRGAAISAAPPPTYTSVRSGSSTNQFRAISVDDVITAIQHLPDKCSAVDPLPAYVLKQVVDLAANLLQRLQSVQNSAARLIYRVRRSERITDVLMSLHWLRIRERVEYKVAVLTCKALNGLVPPRPTCRRLLHMLPTCRLDVDFARRSPTSCWCHPTCGQRSDGRRSRSLAYVWNGLPSDVTSAPSPSLVVFGRRL